MTFWIILAVVAAMLLMLKCWHRWHRPGNDWRERQCLKCGTTEYLYQRTWVRF